MSTNRDMSLAEAFERLAILCERSVGADRSLDMAIALLVFPGLADLRPIKVGIWRHDDGSRIRALRYTGDERAAVSLLAPGHWHEADAHDATCHWVFDPGGGDHAGRNPKAELAICAAALRARRKGDRPKVTANNLL